MMLDSQLEWVSHAGAPQSMVAGAGVTVPFNNIIDELGQGVGTAPANIIGNATLFGADAGIGRFKLEAQINIGTAFATSNVATANFAIQVAPDLGAPTYQPGAWETAAETGAKPVAEMAANTVIRMDLPPAPPLTQRPRYIRMVLLVPAATNFTAGTVTFAGLVAGRDDQTNRQAAANYSVR